MLNMYSVVSNVEWGQIDPKDNRRVGTDPTATEASRHTLTISPELVCSLVAIILAFNK